MYMSGSLSFASRTASPQARREGPPDFARVEAARLAKGRDHSSHQKPFPLLPERIRAVVRTAAGWIPRSARSAFFPLSIGDLGFWGTAGAFPDRFHHSVGVQVMNIFEVPARQVSVL